MFDSSFAMVLLLALAACAALAVATRYHTDHPVADLRHWVQAHHWLDRLHHRHYPSKSRLPSRMKGSACERVAKSKSRAICQAASLRGSASR